MATVRKLAIVRNPSKAAAAANDLRAALGDKVSQHQLAILPLRHADEARPTHIGFAVVDLKLADLEVLKEWEATHPASTVLSFTDTIEAALAGVGLRLHPLA